MGLKGATLKQRYDELIAPTHLEPYLKPARGVALRRLAATAGDGVFARSQTKRVVPR